MRILVDASCLIGLAKVGGLPLLQALPRPVWTTETVRGEVLEGEYPENRRIEHAIKEGVIRTQKAPTDGEDELRGLGAGETSLLALSNEDDLLVLDDGLARREADVQGMAFTGTLGLLVLGAEGGWFPNQDALRLLDRLAESDFRMTVDLYKHARERINQAPNPDV